jgi:hypothetical protein
MLLLDQTLTSLEKQRVLAQATQKGDDFYFQWAPMCPAPGNERTEIPSYQQGYKQFPKQTLAGTQTT